MLISGLVKPMDSTCELCCPNDSVMSANDRIRQINDPYLF
jgi:hypothetical protein